MPEWSKTVSLFSFVGSILPPLEQETSAVDDTAIHPPQQLELARPICFNAQPYVSNLNANMQHLALARFDDESDCYFRLARK
jgi:hypothetical protein